MGSDRHIGRGGSCGAVTVAECRLDTDQDPRLFVNLQVVC